MTPDSGDPGARKRSRAYTERPRRIPPELARDPILELGCSIMAALLLYRVITYADDQGRLPGSPKYLRSIAFGMRDEVTTRKVETALGELVDAGFVIAYTVEGHDFIQVTKWWDLQGAWGRRAYASRYPAPPGWTHDRTFGLGGSEPDAGQVLTDREPDAPPIPDTITSSLPSSSKSTHPSTHTSPSTDTPARTSHGSAPLNGATVGERHAPRPTNGRVDRSKNGRPTHIRESIAAEMVDLQRLLDQDARPAIRADTQRRLDHLKAELADEP